MFATPALAQGPNFYELALISRKPEVAKLYAQSQLHRFGWDNKAQWSSLLILWTRESNWRPNAKNHQPVIIFSNGKKIKLYAGGIPQKLGLSPKFSIPRQIDIGLNYIKVRYGSPAKALYFWNHGHYWY